MTDTEKFINSTQLFSENLGVYTKEFGRRITFDCIMTDDNDERLATLNMGVDNGLKIDDYIALKHIWLE